MDIDDGRPDHLPPVIRQAGQQVLLVVTEAVRHEQYSRPLGLLRVRRLLVLLDRGAQLEKRIRNNKQETISDSRCNCARMVAADLTRQRQHERRRIEVLGQLLLLLDALEVALGGGGGAEAGQGLRGGVEGEGALALRIRMMMMMMR